MKNSKVILVGAGPGDKELITLKGIKAIKAAEIIFYDALVNPELLELARKRHGTRIYVGKRRNEKRFSQDEDPRTPCFSSNYKIPCNSQAKRRGSVRVWQRLGGTEIIWKTKVYKPK